MYLYETHFHTSVGSHCGKATPEEQVEFYAKCGYTGIFLSDHMPISKLFEEASGPWEKQVDLIAESYRRAKARGDELGLDVFFAWEFGHGGMDLLTYGLDIDFVYRHPELRTTEPEDYCALVHEAGGMVVHAHPFREAKYIHKIQLLPWCTDAVETFNACRTDACNEMARLYAAHYGLPQTSGSDNHVAEKLSRLGGIVCREKLTGARDYIDLIRSGEYRLYRNDRLLPEF